MGIIVLPILVGVLIIIFLSLSKLFRLRKKGDLKGRDMVFGFVLTCLIVFAIGVSYVLEGRVYVFSPFFRISFWLFCIPGIIGLFLIKKHKNWQQKTGKVLLGSILFSALIGIVFLKYLSTFFEYLGLETYH